MTRIFMLLTALFVPFTANAAAQFRLTSPLDFQVVQRSSTEAGIIRIEGELSEVPPAGATIEARLLGEFGDTEWTKVDGTISGRILSGTLKAPAGGWWRLEVRVHLSKVPVASSQVAHVGVGEVFVIAGQSNSANHGEERQDPKTDRVVAFDGKSWRQANDPQPGASGNGGSFIPSFADAVVVHENVPVGIIACGIGATSVREWLPQGSTFPNPPTIESRVEKLPSGLWASKGEAYTNLVSRMKSVGPHGFRAVLWHQGESDANQKDPTRTLSGKLYRESLERLITDSRRDIGWNAPWFVAQVSYHVPGDEGSEEIRAAQASLWADGIALEGPDSDALKGNLREQNGQGVHFSGEGLRVLGAKWAEKVLAWLDSQRTPQAANGRPQDLQRLSETDRPNVLLIVTDDQGYGDFSIHGNPHVRTLHIDGLANAGVQFDRFYVNSFCAPTRASLLTGRWSLRTGCHGVTYNREAMRPSEVTIAEVLGSAGYRSACIGKWHNGEQFPFTPQGQGFDESFGFNNGHWNNYFNAVLLRGPQCGPTRGYITDVLTDEAIRFIAQNQTGPFFCYLAYNAPHSPYQVPDPYFEKFKAKGLDDTVAAFYGMCENIDDNVGRLLTFLDEKHLANNTIVLFLTDNGGTAGVKIYNAGMRGGKTSVHEGGTRVPLFIRWPAAQWPPHVVTPIVSHIDILPTLLDLCGVTPPGGPSIDGVSLRPLLQHVDSSKWSERTLFTHNPIDESNQFPGAVRTQKYRLVREIKGPAGGSSATANDKSATPWQLYDMDADPGETTDIASQHPDEVQRLSEQYHAWLADISRDGLQRFPLPVGHAEQNPVELHAPQAYFDKPLHFASGPGYANDWLTNWTDVSAKVWFDIDVVQAGDYEVVIEFSCPPADAGSLLRVHLGNAALEAAIPPAEAEEIPLPHRDEKGKSRYRNRAWANLKLGTLPLAKGPGQLVLEPVRMPGGQVMELKHVELRLLTPSNVERQSR